MYWPLYGEPDLRATYAQLAEAGVRVALPVVVARDAALAFAAWTPGETMVKDGMGVAVPGELHFVERPPALLMPCLGFNPQNFGLGYGGGYYDRTLAEAPRPQTLGIAYPRQQAQFDADGHDVPLDGHYRAHGITLIALPAPGSASKATPSRRFLTILHLSVSSTLQFVVIVTTIAVRQLTIVGWHGRNWARLRKLTGILCKELLER